MRVIKTDDTSYLQKSLEKSLLTADQEKSVINLIAASSSYATSPL